MQTVNLKTMTKNQMITAIQLKEAQLFLRLKEVEYEYGRNSDYTKSIKEKWKTIDDLKTELGIEEMTSELYTPLREKTVDLIGKIARRRQTFKLNNIDTI
jgi:hypothetical protein